MQNVAENETRKILIATWSDYQEQLVTKLRSHNVNNHYVIIMTALHVLVCSTDLIEHAASTHNGFLITGVKII